MRQGDGASGSFYVRRACQITCPPDTPVPYPIPLSRLQVEHAQLHAGFLEHGHGQLVRVRVLVDDLVDAGVDEHLGAHDARLLT